MNYSNFNLEDFVLDETFQRWVKQPDPQNQVFWEDFLRTHPQKRELIEEARKIILVLKFKRVDPLPEEYEKVLQGILKSQPKTRVLSNKSRLYRSLAAAVSLLILASLVFVYLSRPSEIKYLTRSCETQKIMLKDGSVVHLNANSVLYHYDNWNGSIDREVWLKGEAYFEIKKSLSGKQKFIVHTKELDVEVLGTKFNVNDRRGITQVLLNSGKVQLNIHNSPTTKQITMNPGDLIEYSSLHQKISQKIIKKDIYSTWKENRLVFDDVSLGKVAQRIEDNFGYKVIFKDPKLAELRFTGATPANNLDILLKVLEGSFELKIQRLKQEILIQE
ncbi:MAG: FecR domain-containing protein [Microscillaceae bacterium]|nr:FecR domain-containing protein [Microscillaceae bacterium]